MVSSPAANLHASHGAYHVSEGFFETVIPLATDLPFAKSLDFDGAVRYTDYSTSGAVGTLNVGATWASRDDVHLLVILSRDIRAPSLGETYDVGQSGTGNLLDPVNGVTDARSTGNVNLNPGKADTTGVGATTASPTSASSPIAGVTYLDLGVSCKARNDSGEGYFVAENFLDKDPPLVVGSSPAASLRGRPMRVSTTASGACYGSVCGSSSSARTEGCIHFHRENQIVHSVRSLYYRHVPKGVDWHHR